ncbi:ornithine carbamoyltransferase, mitochondrial precursor [Aspergillus terreus NIH2624]|uniref:Ornithine carbamoyltransferase, mitochondrial n=2 Tax=Aspergillus terreus TaxID=33178 RepID=OTC_ASPTE|nr:ornithine carbamoyltransferase, mitochondrial precursor [Aspergillus terreus NIH2624]P0C2P2.1 RecName: Full=Ornithine carbamoyltransferase, mitochondrial; AltName: Full=Ornithine transcarbamylase; Short=OTCase; Flags: Precursor [Aspergillus terreus]P0C2P3.1 RecName: Full=Ornithine carbamoyltransferase, mitochondrial; AltName: Full=Ornithine transcarbamylase; Short=OTCase; Flags: Precursor [Aspergillus terreus NIH2624]EAU34561.1 ornithine carbamoyltransferase, mitochondrial precursor [Aspergil
MIPTARCGALRQKIPVQAVRQYSSSTTLKTSPFAPRHLLSIADLTPTEFTTLVRNASSHKHSIKSGSIPTNLQGSLAGKTVAMMFSKRSTRTRISTEGATVQLGGHPMFLGKDDIQLGVNESLYDTAVVVSSMVSAIVARVGKHAEVADLAKHSTVPVINALCDSFHPLQAIADFQTIYETFTPKAHHLSSLGLEGLKIAWVGDANNVLFDMAISAAKMGVDLAVATPKGYEIPASMRELIQEAGKGVANPGKLIQTNVPEEAVKKADILVTDTWVSMGQEEESLKRMKAFEGFQITSELAKRGGANENWKFMHCLPRHPEEVSDEVFYSNRSLVFPEAENRLWAAISALEGFVVNKGKIA